MRLYNVYLHFEWGWDTYLVKADNVDNARHNAVNRVINELSREIAETIDCIRVYSLKANKLLKEYIIN